MHHNIKNPNTYYSNEYHIRIKTYVNDVDKLLVLRHAFISIRRSPWVPFTLQREFRIIGLRSKVLWNIKLSLEIKLDSKYEINFLALTFWTGVFLTLALNLQGTSSASSKLIALISWTIFDKLSLFFSSVGSYRSSPCQFSNGPFGIVCISLLYTPNLCVGMKFGLPYIFLRCRLPSNQSWGFFLARGETITMKLLEYNKCKSLIFFPFTEFHFKYGNNTRLHSNF